MGYFLVDLFWNLEESSKKYGDRLLLFIGGYLFKVTKVKLLTQIGLTLYLKLQDERDNIISQLLNSDIDEIDLSKESDYASVSMFQYPSEKVSILGRDVREVIKRREGE